MTSPNLAVTIAGVTYQNPVFTCSGTFGMGQEYGEMIDISRLGGITTKGIADVPWEGNPTPRVCETRGGMMNAIGLQGTGVEVFCERDLPYLKESGTGVIVNVCGHAKEEYLRTVDRLAKEDGIDLLEINISCPNVKNGGLSFGTDPELVEEITRACKEHARQPVMMKLTPNVTDIKEIALAAERGGADAISLINTLTGMAIDVERMSFKLANKTGGMSGPAIKPLAVRMVYECASVVNIPIVGMGGISCAEDAIEFMLAGASAVSVGTANFFNPNVTLEIIEGMKEYLIRHEIGDINDIVGAVH